MNRIKYLLLSGLLAVFSASLFAEGTFVLNAERAMLSTQYAQDEFKKLGKVCFKHARISKKFGCLW